MTKPQTLLVFSLLQFLTGCASMFLHGGAMKDTRYEPEILVKYRVEGTSPPGTEYALVRTEDGRSALFEQSEDRSGVLITNQWQEDDGDHFFVWVGSSHGYEYVVPRDRTLEAKKYVYPAGYYSVKKEDGIEKPVVSVELDPVARLIPTAPSK